MSNFSMKLGTIHWMKLVTVILMVIDCLLTSYNTRALSQIREIDAGTWVGRGAIVDSS